MLPEEINAIGLSVRVAIASVLVSLPFGLGMGWLLGRRSFRGKWIVETIVNLPLVLPPVVTGYLLLVTLGRNGLMGGLLENWFGMRFVFDFKGAVLAAAIVSFPLMVRSIRIAVAGVDRRYEDASHTLGAGAWETFWRITFPMARRGVIAGCVLAFARSLGEFGATIMIAGNLPGQTQTIPLYLYDQLQSPDAWRQSIGIVIASVLLAAAALAVGQHLERRDESVSPP